MKRILFFKISPKPTYLYVLAALSLIVAIPPIYMTSVSGFIYLAIIYGIASVVWSLWIYYIARRILIDKEFILTYLAALNGTGLKRMMLIERVFALLIFVASFSGLIKGLVSNAALFDSLATVWGIVVGAGHFLFTLITVYCNHDTYLKGLKKEKNIND